MSTADGIRFTPWPHDHFPSWSLPALEAAKCAAKQGDPVFDRVHLALFEAFFTGSRDIGDRDEVTRILVEAGADRERFAADYAAGIGREALAADFEAAFSEHGIRSIPTVIVPATGRALVGLAGLGEYRAAVEEALDRPG